MKFETMGKTAICILLFLYAQFGLAQIAKTDYLDDNFKVIKSSKPAAYIQYAEYNDENQLNGNITIFYADSTKYMSGFYFNGKRYGKFIWYWPGGTIRTQGSYSADIQIGEWYTYLKDGQQDVYEIFDNNGVLTSTYPNEESIFGYVEDWPKWKGCNKEKTLELQKSCTDTKRGIYLKSCQYPISVTDKKPMSVHMYCIIDKTGKATEVHVTLTSGNKEVDAAAEEWIRNMPEHIPGTWHTKTVKVQLNLVVEFIP